MHSMSNREQRTENGEWRIKSLLVTVRPLAMSQTHIYRTYPVMIKIKYETIQLIKQRTDLFLNSTPLKQL